MNKTKLITMLLVLAIALFSVNANKGCWGQKIVDHQEPEIITTGSSGGAGGSSGGGQIETGWLVSAYMGEGNSGSATDVTSDSTYLYIAGWYLTVTGTATIWRIEKRIKTTGALADEFGFSGVVTSTGNPAAISSPNDIESDTEYLYIVGYDTTTGAGANAQWRLEKRSKATGALVSGFGTNGAVTENIGAGSDIAYAVAVDDNSIYIAGQASGANWRIEKRNKTTGALDAAFGTGGVIGSVTGLPTSIIINGSSVYIAGYDNSGGGSLRAELRDSATGALTRTATGNPSAGSDAINVLYSDGLSVYFGGYDSALGNNQWWHAKINSSFDALDSTFGTGGIVTENPSPSDDIIFGLTADMTYLYVAGSDSSSGRWRIEKRYKTNGVLEEGFGASGALINDPSGSADQAFDIASDDIYIYVVGYDNTGPGAGVGTTQQWRIEKRYKTTGSF